MNAPISQDDWKNATEMHLRCEPYSAQALDLLDRIMAQLTFPTGGTPDRPSTWKRRRKALGALLADLMKAEADGQAGSHGMKRDEFPAKVLGFGFDIFQPLKDAMVSAGLLSFEPGKPRWETVQPYHGGEGVIHNAGGCARASVGVCCVFCAFGLEIYKRDHVYAVRW